MPKLKPKRVKYMLIDRDSEIWLYNLDDSDLFKIDRDHIQFLIGELTKLGE